jgi:hypothetical protein
MLKPGMVVPMLLLLAATLAAACGGSSSKTDGDAREDELPLPDADADLPVDVPADETVAPDPSDSTDPAAEDFHEVPPDSAEDGDAADSVEDEAADAPVDMIEEEFPSHCLPLEGEITGLYSWTLAWMGTGTNATFTLQITNPNDGPDCAFSGIAVAEAWLKRSGDDSGIIKYATVEANPDLPASSLDPGQSSSAGLIARHGDSTTSDCMIGVYVELMIDYVIDGTFATTLVVASSDVTHECVY